MVNLPRPELRLVESVVVHDAKRGRLVVLRDTEGIAPAAVVLSPEEVNVASRFDGRRSIDSIATQTGVSIDRVARLARELDEAFMLVSPRFQARRNEVVRAFAEAPSRKASHAAGAYPGDADELTDFLETSCFAKAKAHATKDTVLAIAAPHMDLWRAAVGYGHAYRGLAAKLAPEADTFFLLGTCHAPMERPFALCAKAFETPLGALEPDRRVLGELAAASRFDVYAEQYLHKAEHSLEFQAVLLKHTLGERPFRIVPVLCGLGDSQASRRDPRRDADAESFLSALRGIVEDLGDRAVLVAGADLAHVGPRFGDASPLDEQGRGALGRTDGASIDLARSGDAPGFFQQVAADLSTRRVCGLGPTYTLLRALPDGARGDLLHYAQCIDPDDGSIVSHASIAWTA